MTKQKKELTFSQQVALDGEIAYAIATSSHDDEVIYRMYSVLLTVPKELYGFVLESFTRLSEIPEEKIMRVRSEITLGKVPIWIWENKCISDLKECIKYSTQNQNISSITANPKTLRIRLIESALIFFVRRTAMLSPQAAYNLCIRILDERSLKCLEKVCTYLIGELSELPMKSKVSKETLQKIMENNFDLRETLSFKLEIKALDILDNKEDLTKKSNKVSFKIKDEVIKAILEAAGGAEEAENPIETLITATLQNEQTENTDFVVKKIFNGSKKVTTLETFKTREEAENFIKTILSNMPELSQTCTFVIEHQIK